jgi:hypothetical protein
MKYLLTEVSVRRAPAHQLIQQREFLRRLYHLGVNAREQRESEFTVKFDPASRQRLLLSEITLGGTTHINPGQEPEPSAIGMHTHNHPVIKDKLGNWTNFFSDNDLQGPFQHGAVTGLVFVPHGLESLILVMAQLKSPLTIDAGASFYDKVADRFVESIGRGLLKSRDDENFNLETAWIQAATESLEQSGARSGVFRCAFPCSAAEDLFIKLNLRATQGLQASGFRLDKRMIENFIKKRERQMVDEVAGLTDMFNLMVCKRLGIDARTLEKTLAIVRNNNGQDDGREPPSLAPLPFLPDLDNFRSVDSLLEDKIFIPSPDPVFEKFYHEAYLELARQMIEKGLIQAKPFSHGRFVSCYLATPDEAEKLSAIELYSINDLTVKLGMDEESILELIAAEKIKPDFVLRIDGDEKAFYVFLHVPEIDRP